MSVKTASERMAGPIGEDLAQSDDQTQAEFFNAFARSLKTCCRGGYGGGWDNQLCNIEKHLNANARQMLKDFAEFVALGEEADR